MPRDGRPTDPETRAEVLRLCREGKLGRNAIAREVGLSGSTVTAIAQEIGHEFDWKATEIAVAARLVQASEIRENLASAFLLEALRALDDMHAPALTYQFEQGRVETITDADGASKTITRPGEFREHVLPEPSFSDRRNLMTIAGIAITKASEVSRPQAGQGSEEGISILVGLARAIDAMADGSLADVDPTVEPRPGDAPE